MYLAAAILIVLFIGLALVMYAPATVRAAPAVATPRSVPLPYYGVQENFKVTDLPIGGGDSPALDSPRTPYTLLNDALTPIMTGEPPLEQTTAQSCNATDYNAAHSLTGNFSKITNNNMPTYPDNCTGPRQEFTMSFYKKEAAGPAPAYLMGGSGFRK
jgi:hypothetical protein